ncbi:MAG TPA: hypothetical protein VK893_12250, partial [Pyrinomonadaceae bacterium]|nr:hypothetical protein [Pyrinomonadaceae bacterium]
MSRSLVKDQLNSNTPPPRSKTLHLRRILLPAIIVILALAFSCSRQTEPGAPQPDRSTIKIGYFGDLSGPTYNFGQSAQNGVLM